MPFFYHIFCQFYGLISGSIEILQFLECKFTDIEAIFLMILSHKTDICENSGTVQNFTVLLDVDVSHSSS